MPKLMHNHIKQQNVLVCVNLYVYSEEDPAWMFQSGIRFKYPDAADKSSKFPREPKQKVRGQWAAGEPSKFFRKSKRKQGGRRVGECTNDKFWQRRRELVKWYQPVFDWISAYFELFFRGFCNRVHAFC